jgi:hypothetical protein
LSPPLCFGQVPGCLHITVCRAAPPESYYMALFVRQEKIFIFSLFFPLRKKPFFPWEIEKEGFCVGHE